MRWRASSVFLGALVLCLVAGCYERVADGNLSFYHAAAWVGPTIVGIGVLSMLLGSFVWKKNKGLAIVFIILPLFLVPLLAPSMYSDRVIIDDDHFETSYGFWFSPNYRSIHFADLTEIRYVALGASRGGTKYELHCLTRKGRVEVIHGGDLAIHAFPEILERAKAKGVAVTLGR